MTLQTSLSEIAELVHRPRSVLLVACLANSGRHDGGAGAMQGEVIGRRGGRKGGGSLVTRLCAGEIHQHVLRLDV